MADTGTNSRISDQISRRALAYAALLAVALTFGLHALFISGPAMRAAAREQLEQTIAGEDRAFCEKFGMGAGTDGFVACRRELAIIRQQQTERENAAAQGIL